jgi:hypothetical protein
MERELLHPWNMTEPLDELLGVPETLIDSPWPPDEARRPRCHEADLERDTACLSSMMERTLERFTGLIRLAAPGVNGGDAPPRDRKHFVILGRFPGGDGGGRLLVHGLERALGILK